MSRVLSFDMELSYDCGTLSDQLASSLASMYFDIDKDLWICVVKKDCWAPALWAGTEGLPIVWEWLNAPTERFIVQQVDLANRWLYLKSYTPVT